MGVSKSRFHRRYQAGVPGLWAQNYATPSRLYTIQRFNEQLLQTAYGYGRLAV